MDGKRSPQCGTENEMVDGDTGTRPGKKRKGKLAVLLAVILIVFATAGLLLRGEVMGSSDCVIAEDYSYLTLCGQRYVPLVLVDAECKVSERLIREAQVEGLPFVVKLFFGDSVYSVEHCPDNEIVYLQTEQDDLISQYYCAEAGWTNFRKCCGRLLSTSERRRSSQKIGR